MSDDEPPQRPLARETLWDQFVDALDRAGQAGTAADVLTPTTLHPDAPSGRRFGDLTRVEIDNLVKIGGNLGRRGDVVKTMWTQTQEKLKRARRAKH